MTGKSHIKPAKEPEKKQSATGAEDASNQLAALQSMGFGTVATMGTNWVETMSELGSEVLSFVAERVQEDVKTQHELMHCKDVQELQEIQTRFMQKAIEQYTAETGKLVEIGKGLFTHPTDSTPV